MDAALLPDQVAQVGTVAPALQAVDSGLTRIHQWGGDRQAMKDALAAFSAQKPIEFTPLPAPRIAFKNMKTFADWSPDAPGSNKWRGYENFHMLANAGANQPTVDGQLSSLAAPSIFRFQGDAATETWEKRELRANKMFCNYTFFPAVMTTPGRTYAMSYTVLYTSFNPTLTGWLGSSGVAKIPTNYKKFQHDGGGGSAVFIDHALIGDASTELAILSAVNATNPHSNSFISLVPNVSEALYAQQSSGLGTSPFRIKGASLGCAVFAAIMGMGPIHYTGYVSAIAPGKKISRPAQWMTKEGVAVNFGGQGDANGISAVSKTYNFVEQVDHLEYKIAYALEQNIALITPSKLVDGQNLQSYLLRYPGKHYRLENLPYMVSCSDLADGWNYSLKPSPLLIGYTIAEYGILSAVATLAYIAGTANSDRTRKETEDTVPFEDYRKQQTERFAAKRMATIGRSVERKAIVGSKAQKDAVMRAKSKAVAAARSAQAQRDRAIRVTMREEYNTKQAELAAARKAENMKPPPGARQRVLLELGSNRLDYRPVAKGETKARSKKVAYSGSLQYPTSRPALVRAAQQALAAADDAAAVASAPGATAGDRAAAAAAGADAAAAVGAANAAGAGEEEDFEDAPEDPERPSEEVLLERQAASERARAARLKEITSSANADAARRAQAQLNPESTARPVVGAKTGGVSAAGAALARKAQAVIARRKAATKLTDAARTNVSGDLDDV